MGVIIQEMIDAQWSGVAFSINPVTGRPEMVIEGISGSGEKLVHEGVTPHRWKYCQGSWEPYDEGSAPPLQVLQSITRGLEQLRKSLGGEVDIEWAWDGSKVWYLQCRSITTSTRTFGSTWRRSSTSCSC